MAPPTTRRSRTHPQKNKNDKTPSSGVSKRSQEKAKLDKLAENLETLENTYDEADPEKKAEMEQQRNIVKKQQKIVDSMEVDHSDRESEQPDKDQADGDEPRNSSESPSKADNSSPAEDSGYGSDDDLGRVEKSDDVALTVGGELEQYFKGRFGHYYGVYRHGPRNAARHNIRFLAEKNHLPEELAKDPSKDMDRNSRIPKNGAKTEGKIFRVLSAAWDSVDEDSRMDLLAPHDWKTEKGGSCAPPIKVQVRWFSDDGPVSWEWRGAAKRHMYSAGAVYSAPKSIDYDDRVILEKGSKIHRADFLIIDTAVRLEKRHREWQDGHRRSADREPTPGLPIRSEQESTPSNENE